MNQFQDKFLTISLSMHVQQAEILANELAIQLIEKQPFFSKRITILFFSKKRITIRSVKQKQLIEQNALGYKTERGTVLNMQAMVNQYV